MEVVGESHYREAIARLCGEPGEQGEDFYCTAILECDDNNAYDQNAVKVLIAGEHVGHLSRDAARAYRRQYGSQALECPAHITAGWDRGGGDRGDYCVRLSIDLIPTKP
jgi:hypothetical protein